MGILNNNSYKRQVPSTGFNITIPNDVTSLILDPASTLATGTITMPAKPVDGQAMTICSSKVIAVLTLKANTGQSLIGGLTTFGVGGSASYIYVKPQATWYRTR